MAFEMMAQMMALSTRLMGDPEGNLLTMGPGMGGVLGVEGGRGGVPPENLRSHRFPPSLYSNTSQPCKILHDRDALVEKHTVGFVVTDNAVA